MTIVEAAAHHDRGHLMPTSTNGEMIRAGVIPCETNKYGGLARTGDAFHARAVLTVGQTRDGLRHVCEECALLYHRHQKQRAGILWE